MHKACYLHQIVFIHSSGFAGHIQSSTGFMIVHCRPCSCRGALSNLCKEDTKIVQQRYPLQKYQGIRWILLFHIVAQQCFQNFVIFAVHSCRKQLREITFLTCESAHVCKTSKQKQTAIMKSLGVHVKNDFLHSLHMPGLGQFYTAGCRWFNVPVIRCVLHISSDQNEHHRNCVHRWRH